jgi:hypothetical protein
MLKNVHCLNAKNSSFLSYMSGIPKIRNRRYGLIKYIGTKAKCRHLKKLTYKGTLRQVFIRIYRLEIQSVMLVFSTQLCEPLPHLPFSLVQPPPPLPLPCVKVQNTDSVWLGGGVGVLSPVGDHILQEFTTLYLT